MKLQHLLILFALMVSTSTYANVPPSDANTYTQEVKDKKASFPGGKEALKEWLKENMDYPEDMRRYGSVMIDFVVKKNGKTTDFKVHKGVNEELDILAVEILRGMPKWEPAMKNGKAVDSNVQLPVKFVPKSDKGGLGD